MQILFVEDNLSYAENLKEVIEAEFLEAHCQIIDNSSGAEELILKNFYDLVILDLCMPNEAQGVRKNVEYGQDLFYRLQQLMPGTPIYILTGSELDNFATGLSRHGEKVKLWGSTKYFPTVLYFNKNQTKELIAEIGLIYPEIVSVNSVSINTRGKKIVFSKEQERALKCFARSSGGLDMVYHPLSGLSGSLVGRIEIRDRRFITIGAFVAKLGVSSKLIKEKNSYTRYVTLMPINTFTPLLHELDKGCKHYSAIFYTLAEEYKQALFGVIAKDNGNSVKVIEKVRASLERWSNAREVKQTSIREIRRIKLDDAAFDEIRLKYSLDDLCGIEDIIVNASLSCIHGDLHGGNVLVDSNNAPVLIDFGDVGPGFSGLDPITLELSLVFHPDCVSSGVSDLLLPMLEHWPYIDKYCQDNSFSSVIKYCRDWAYDISGDDRAVLAVGYAFAIRQLKYETVSSERTLILIKSIANCLRGG